MELTDRQIGTLVLALQNSFKDREDVKKLAKKANIKHLNNLDDEYKLLLILTDEIKKRKKKNKN